MKKTNDAWHVIRNKCREYDWGQIDLARVMMVSQATISNMAKIGYIPSKKILKKLVSVFGEDIDYWYALFDKQAGDQGDPKQSEESRLAELYKEYPIRLLKRIGWIRSDTDSQLIAEDVSKLDKVGMALKKEIILTGGGKEIKWQR